MRVIYKTEKVEQLFLAQCIVGDFMGDIVVTEGEGFWAGVGIN